MQYRKEETMASDDLKEDKEAFDALESEAREFDKVCAGAVQTNDVVCAWLTNVYQDAEIDRILRAFRLDA